MRKLKAVTLIIVGCGMAQNTLFANSLYWTDAQSSVIRQSNLAGTNVQSIVTNVGAPRDITVDPSGGKLYWTDAQSSVIRQSNLNGTDVQNIVTNVGAPLDITVDPIDGKLYWTDAQSSIIHQSNLNGTDVQNIVTNVGAPYDLAVAVPTPEPATLTLLGSALLLIGGIRLLRWRQARH